MAYLHPIISGKEHRPNLTILVEAWVSRLNLVDADPSSAPPESTGSSVPITKKAESITLTLKDGKTFNLGARNEIILCGGAIDTPKLLLHSGIGPKEELEKIGIKVQHNILGVGENLMDHPGKQASRPELGAR